ncbi:hypothetical protein GQ457_15G009030 [Hibiscus cannabinus]
MAEAKVYQGPCLVYQVMAAKSNFHGRFRLECKAFDVRFVFNNIVLLSIEKKLLSRFGGRIGFYNAWVLGQSRRTWTIDSGVWTFDGADVLHNPFRESRHQRRKVPFTDWAKFYSQVSSRNCTMRPLPNDQHAITHVVPMIGEF